MTIANKTYRIKSRFRFITSITLAVIMVCFMANTVLGLDNASGMTEPKEPYQVEIHAGDSLWNIASEYGPDDIDIRKVVHEICELNGVTADTLQPGQIILVPAYN